MLEIHRCNYCSFSFTQADKAWDSVLATGTCPKCKSELHIFRKKETKQNQSEKAKTSRSENKKLHNHYDNLKVARNAPLEVIRAAYKTLSQKYHPDRNSDNPDASRIMAIINASYEVLSDPQKRKEHDAWIAEKESTATEQNKPSQRPEPVQTSQPTTASITFKSVISHVFRNWLIYVIIAAVIWGNFAEKTYSPPPPGPKPYIANPTPEIEPTPAPPVYEKPLYAPNGEPWPANAGYVQGYKKLHTNGLSSVTVDNTQNDSDVFVKLVSLEGTEAYPVRQFYIPAYSKFTVNKVNAGSYDVRYRDLNSGGLSRSESFNLEETEIDGGTQFSNYTMTLYKVRDGNMQTYGLSEAEF